MFCLQSESKDFAIIYLAITDYLYKKSCNLSEQSYLFDQCMELNSRYYIEKLADKILSLRTGNPNICIGVDMHFIGAFSGDSESQERPFEKLRFKIGQVKNVFFWGLNENSMLQHRICNELCIDSSQSDEALGLIFLDSNNAKTKNNVKLILECEQLMRNNLKSIIESTITRWTTNNEDLFNDPLASSGVYSDTYVDIKQLFLQSDKLGIIIFEMAKKLLPELHNIDALVCTSKNGAVLASLLGQLLKKKVVYCINVGPQYAIPVASLEKSFRTGKRYAYIYDFLCLGTEVKILNAFVTSRNAKLVMGIGIASYIPLDNPSFEKQKSPLHKMDCLINIIKENIPYEINVQKSKLVRRD